MVTEMEMCESPDVTPLDFCLWVWMKNCVHKGRSVHETNCSLAVWMLLPA